MKNFFKKLTAVICSVSAAAMLLTASITVSAQEVPRTQDQAGQVNTTSTVNTSSGTASDTSATQSSGTVTSTNSVTQSAGKAESKSSGWSGFWWFLLSVVVNFILSCWVANRFYRMARRNTQSSAEIRALRKDIEEKFGDTLRDISEPAAEVVNRNENYARSDEGLEMPERKSHVEFSEDESEVMKRWDSQRAAAREEQSEEPEDDYEERPARHAARGAYRPERSSAGIEFEDEEDDAEPHEARRPARMPSRKETAAALSNAKDKAKSFLGNVFPFDE